MIKSKVKLAIFFISVLSNTIHCISWKYKVATALLVAPLVIPSTLLAFVIKKYEEGEMKETLRTLPPFIKELQEFNMIFIDIYSKTQHALTTQAKHVTYKDGTILQLPATYANFYSQILLPKKINTFMQMINHSYSASLRWESNNLDWQTVNNLCIQAQLNVDSFEKNKTNTNVIEKEDFLEKLKLYEKIQTEFVVPWIKKLEKDLRKTRFLLPIYQSRIGSPFVAIRYLPISMLVTFAFLFNLIVNAVIEMKNKVKP